MAIVPTIGVGHIQFEVFDKFVFSPYGGQDIGEFAGVGILFDDGQGIKIVETAGFKITPIDCIGGIVNRGRSD